MKNKKKGVLIAVVVIALIVAAVAAVCINKKAGDSGKLKEGQTETTVKKSDTKVITFAVPDICRIDENNVKQFNAALMSDGYNYELNIKYLEYDEYSQKLESAFAAGETDVAFLGLGDENGNNPVYDLISSDLVLNLDDVLSKDQGKTWSQKELEKTDSKVVYLTPSHQYPTGVTIPISNRYKLLNWAKENDSFIIEDDYDTELNYINRPIPSLQGLDTQNRVIYIGTFSKSLCASLRVGYMVLPNSLMDIYYKFENKHSTVPIMTQKILEKFMSEGHWEKHLRKIRTINSKKHNLMKSELLSKLGNTVKIENFGGGLSIVINPKVPMDIEKLKSLAIKEKIKLYFAKDVSGGDWDAIRMGFGGFKQNEIKDAINAFSKIWFASLIG